MRVVFLSSLAGPDGAYAAGTETDLPASRAEGLERAGIVRALNAETTATAPAETTAAPAPERRGKTRGV